MQPVDRFAGVCTCPQYGLRTLRWTGANLLQAWLVLEVRPGPAKQMKEGSASGDMYDKQIIFLARRKGNPAF